METKPDMSSTCGSEPCPIWNTGAWSECTAECGGGVQERRIQCRDKQGHNSPEYACNIALKPNSTKTCNEHPCSQENETKLTIRYRWAVGVWTEVSIIHIHTKFEFLMTTFLYQYRIVVLFHSVPKNVERGTDAAKLIAFKSHIHTNSKRLSLTIHSVKKLPNPKRSEVVLDSHVLING